MRHLRLFAIGLAGAALLSCGGDDLVLPGDGEPAVITVVQGDSLSGRVGEALAEPLVVEVLDVARRPVAAATVVIEIAGAVAEPDTISTAADGRASAEITLGSTVGEAAGAVRVIAPEGPAEVSATFTVVAVAASANGLAAVSGDGQTAPVGTQLPLPLVVEVTDAFGNPIAGIPIAWTPDAGSVSEASTTTDAAGRVSVTRTLGPTAGAQTTLASSEGLAGSPVTFSHTAGPGNASGVLIADGDDQTAAPRTTLPKDLVVQVVDEAGNPVVGAAVTWVVTAGGGTLSPTTGTTDENGRAATKWTLGATAGINTAQAIVSGVGQAEFSATAAAGTAAEIRVISGNGQTGQAGVALASALVVEVLDGNENPVGGVPVTWTVEDGGSLAPPSAATGADGRTSTVWTLGPGVGRQQAEASAPGAGSVRFQATSTAGAPSALGLTTQPSGTSRVGVPFGRQPVVQVRDAAGNPVQAPGVTVTAAVASGTGQLIGTAIQTTGSNGRATFTNLGIGGAVGPHSLNFAAGGFTSVTSETFDIIPVGTTTRIASDTPDPSAPGQEVDVVFEVTSPGGTPSGTVEVTVSGGSETCSAPVATGRCTIVLVGGDGNRTLTARFPGGTLFTASSGTAAHGVVTPDTPPTAVGDGYAATAGVQISVPAPGVLGNDSDADGDPLSAQVLTSTTHGNLTLNSNGSFSYLPDATFFGQDAFTYRVTAGGATSDATVTIVVSPPGP